MKRKVFGAELDTEISLLLSETWDGWDKESFLYRDGNFRFFVFELEDTENDEGIPMKITSFRILDFDKAIDFYFQCKEKHVVFDVAFKL